MAEYQAMETVPAGYKERGVQILVWTDWGPKIARWNPDTHRKFPRPFWELAGVRTMDARNHQPFMWMKIPRPTPEVSK